MEAVSRESVPEIIREHKEKGYFMENILRIYDVFKEFFGEERVDLRIDVSNDKPNIYIKTNNGLLIDYSDRMKADVIVRGIRAVSDFEYELMMAQTNKQLNPNIETMFFATSAEYSFVSSSMIRELAAFDGDITPFVPEEVSKRVYEKYKQS